MKNIASVAWCTAFFCAVLFCTAFLPQPVIHDQPGSDPDRSQPKVLIFSKTNGYRHASITLKRGIAAR